ncbi:large ribosomal subunit protein eL37-like, partial [Hemiscyllium ocellatum]|uniref:large ribosomal subunit protein eL37-like n=1 Tax=Hemiscyllium ocellatum TaxID=170820 RepID=UPI0029662D90
VPTKGTLSFGRKQNKTHTFCQQCGATAIHLQKPNNKRKGKLNWNADTKMRNTMGSGWVRHSEVVYHSFRNGFHMGTTLRPRRVPKASSSTA